MLKAYRPALAPRNSGGFTLVEIAIVVVIAALLLSLLSGYLNNALKQGKAAATTTRMTVIEQALKEYVGRNNRLPRPALRNVRINTTDYGREIAAAGAVAPGVITTGAAGSTILIGMVPTRTINLPDEFGYDGWGSRIVYVVTEDLTRTNTFNLADGAIDIRDSGGNSMITPERSGTFLLLSPGPDREDGYNAEGLRAIECNTTQADGQNCNGDGIFTDTLSMSDAGATQFDDYIDYEANFALSDGMPAGTVIAYNGITCPPGWTAVAGMAGRVIIGSGAYAETTSPSTAPVTTYSGQTYALGALGGHATRSTNTTFNTRINNMPPYRTFLYCEKGAP